MGSGVRDDVQYLCKDLVRTDGAGSYLVSTYAVQVGEVSLRNGTKDNRGALVERLPCHDMAPVTREIISEGR